MAHILSISYDPILLSTRQVLLESRGHTVTSAEGYIEAMRKCREGDYDLLIIGHSIPHEDKKTILNEMRQHCDAPVLALVRSGEQKLDAVNEAVDASRPDLLVAAVERLTRRAQAAD
jgi:DNA-binding response OmpR family regulator